MTGKRLRPPQCSLRKQKHLAGRTPTPEARAAASYAGPLPSYAGPLPSYAGPSYPDAGPSPSCAAALHASCRPQPRQSAPPSPQQLSWRPRRRSVTPRAKFAVQYSHRQHPQLLQPCSRSWERQASSENQRRRRTLVVPTRRSHTSEHARALAPARQLCRPCPAQATTPPSLQLQPRCSNPHHGARVRRSYPAHMRPRPRGAARGAQRARCQG